MIQTQLTHIGERTWATMANDIAYEGAACRVGNEWEKHLMDRLLGAARLPGGVILDLGAGIGANTLRFAEAVGTGLVYAVEIQRIVFQSLCANVFINGFDNVVAIQAAVGDNWRQFWGHFSGWSDVDYRSRGFDTGGVRTEPKRGGLYYFDQSLNIAVDGLNVRDVRAIKLDLEGHEFHALKGAEQTIRRDRPPILCELSETYLKTHGYTPRAVVEWMKNMFSYSAEWLDETNVLFLP